MTRLLCLCLLALTLSSTGCPPPNETPSASAEPAAEANAEASPATAPPSAGDADQSPAASASGATVYPVACGCSLEEVGHCGEYAQVDGTFEEITGELGLGEMPFCGKDGLEAEIEGQLVDGKLAATRLTIVE